MYNYFPVNSCVNLKCNKTFNLVWFWVFAFIVFLQINLRMVRKKNFNKFKCEKCNTRKTCLENHSDEQCFRTICYDCARALGKFIWSCAYCQHCQIIDGEQYKDPKGRLAYTIFCSKECFDRYWVDWCLETEPEESNYLRYDAMF